MSVIDCLLSALGFDEDISPESYRFTVMGKKGGVIEGVKKILHFCDTQIIFELKEGNLCLTGENLKIFKYTKNEAVVKGYIKGVNLQ